MFGPAPEAKMSALDFVDMIIVMSVVLLASAIVSVSAYHLTR